MTEILINANLYRGKEQSQALKAATTSNGDVQITSGPADSYNVIATIPKDKRAELAHFLAHAQ